MHRPIRWHRQEISSPPPTQGKREHRSHSHLLRRCCSKKDKTCQKHQLSPPPPPPLPQTQQLGTRTGHWVDLMGVQMHIHLRSRHSNAFVGQDGGSTISPQTPSSSTAAWTAFSFEFEDCFFLSACFAFGYCWVGLFVWTWKCRVGGSAEATFLLLEFECGLGYGYEYVWEIFGRIFGVSTPPGSPVFARRSQKEKEKGDQHHHQQQQALFAAMESQGSAFWDGVVGSPTSSSSLTTEFVEILIISECAIDDEQHSRCGETSDIALGLYLRFERALNDNK